MAVSSVSYDLDQLENSGRVLQGGQVDVVQRSWVHVRATTVRHFRLGPEPGSKLGSSVTWDFFTL